jgi:biotin transporter BioY
MDFSEINWIALIVATVAAYGLGALWYGPVFGKVWQKQVGLTEEDIKGANMAQIFGSTLVLTFIMGLGIALFGDLKDWMSGLQSGLLFGVFFVATSAGINYLYQQKSLKLWLIDAGYQVIFLGIFGAILGAWH